MIEKQFNEITKWQKQTFGATAAQLSLDRLKNEIYRLEIDLRFSKPEKRLEFANCFILLFGAAASDGMSYNDIIDAIEEKMKIYYAMQWGKPDFNGVVNHIE